MSATIVTLHDPAGINRKDVEHVPCGTLLFPWLIERYGSDGFNVQTTVYKNGIEECHIIDLDKAANDGDGINLNDDDLITICHCPTASAAAIFAISFVISIIIASLIKKPKIPELNTPTESPNNALIGQTNIARPNQRIPDIYGENIVWPDLAQATIFEFINNVKFMSEYLIIGRGYYLVEDLKSGSTLISDISGASSAVFDPFTRPAILLSGENSNEVNGQRVFAPNEPLLGVGQATVDFIDSNTFEGISSSLSDFREISNTETFVIAGIGYSEIQLTGSSDIDFATNQITSGPVDLSVFSVGDFVAITGTASNNRLVKLTVVTSGALTCVDPVTLAPVSFTTEASTSAALDSDFPNAGTFTFINMTITEDEDLIDPDVYIINVTETTFSALTGSSISCVATQNKPTTIGPFVVPGKPDQIWFDINFPQGLKDGSDAYAVRFNFKLQEIDSLGAPVGGAEDNFITMAGKTTNPQNFTNKIIPDNPGGLYEVSVVRISNRKSTQDQSKWARMAGIENVTVTDFGNVTAVEITTEATEQATSIQNREFNAKVTRKLFTYENGAVTTTRLPTARMADAMLDILTDPFMGNKPVSQIDLDELYAIQVSLDSDPIYGDKLGRFCYSFSNSRTPVGEEMIACANACRVFVYREGDLVRFTRDEIQPNRVTLFNRRNKRPNSEQKTETFQKPSDFDSIELSWVEEGTGDPYTIWATATGTTSVDPGDGSNQVPKQIDAAGVKNYEQSWNRAAYEFLRLKHERTQVQTTVTKEGLLVPLNGRIAIVDGTDVTAQDGEILAINGLICDTSERPRFDSGSATVILRAENGDLSDPIVVTARSDTDKGFLLNNLPGFAIVVRGDNGNQVGTIYNFSPDSNHLASDYKAQEITPNPDGYVDLKLVNYAPEIFAPDTQTPTLRADT